MEDKIIKITVGIRFRRSFRVSDISGQIIDYFLRDESSPFKDIAFDKVGDTGNRGKVLVDEKGNTLSIDIDSLILSVNTSNLELTLKKFKDVYFPYFEKGVFKTFSIENFNRLGIIFEHQLESDSLINKAIKTLSSDKIEVPDNCEIRFSKKIPNTKSLINKDIIDFLNVIFTYNKNSKGLNIKLDYQLYFNPEVAKANDLGFNGFIDSAGDFLRQNFYKW